MVSPKSNTKISKDEIEDKIKGLNSILRQNLDKKRHPKKAIKDLL